MPRDASAGKASWQEVRGRCPICHSHGWCRVSPDGAMVACRRYDRGAIRRLDYPDGPAWLHADGGRRSCSDARPSQAKPKPGTPVAPDDQLDRVYRAMLACPELQLADAHRGQLFARGLVEADIVRNSYRSLPAASRGGILRKLRDHFTDALLLTTPGVYVRDGRFGRYLTLAGAPGLLTPVRSVAGHIIGLLVRPDEALPGKKYLWLSSEKHGGPSPGARVHVPAGVGTCERAAIVEGVLKADVAHALSGRPVIGLPGCHVSSEAIATLRALGVREALLALDADVRENPHVARAPNRGAASAKRIRL